MNGSGALDRVIRFLGAQPRDVFLLMDALRKQKRARLQLKLKNGIDLDSLKVLILIPLALLFVTILIATVAFRDDPGLVAGICLSAYAFIFLSLLASSIFQDLLGDEDFRVIAPWPVSSNSFLLARLLLSARSSLGLFLTIAIPGLGCSLFAVGTPVLTGLVLFLVLLLFALSLLLMTSALISWLIGLIGINRLRSWLAASMFTVLVVLLLLARAQPVTELASPPSFELFPGWFPITWLAGLVVLSSQPASPELLVHAGLSFLCLLPLPVLTFRFAARGYTTSLISAQIKRARTRGAFFVRLLALGSNRVEDKVLARLCVAHARGDWRFRMQILAAPAFLTVMFLGTSIGSDGTPMFADPFVHTGWFHPSMVLMVLVMLPPIFALPLISLSSHYKAAWILRLGSISERAYRGAVRRLFRLAFVFPFLFVLFLAYVWQAVDPLHLLAHLFVLFLLAELMVCQMQQLFDGFPFSLETGDEEMMFKLMPVILMLEIFGGMVSGVIYNIGYRWWWAYLLTVALMVYIRRATLKPAGETKALDMEAPVPEKIMATTPLIGAIKEGRFHTARVLIEGGSDVLAVDEEGKTAADWAEELGHQQLLKLLREAKAARSP